MNPGTPRTPATPPTDIEAGQSPAPPRNDHADADSSAQRKRPRLDSGEGVHRSKSAELPAAQDEPHTPTHPPRNSIAVADGTPSRVTINVRPPLLDASPKDPSDGALNLNLLQGVEELPPSPVQLISNVSIAQEEDTSSALSSPRIEAAEPEDIVLTPSAVAIDRYDDLQIHRLLMNDFPYHGKTTPLEETLEEIQNFLLRDDASGRPSIFQSVVEWMERYIECTDRLSSKWFDFYAEHREFWDAIPFFLSALLTKATASVCLPSQPKDSSINEGSSSSGVGRLLKAYVRLAARTVLIDTRTLHEITSENAEQPDLLSTMYLKLLVRVVRSPENEPLLRSLRAVDASPSVVAQNCLNAFQASLPGGLNCLSRYALGLLERPILEEDAMLRCIEMFIAYVSSSSRYIKDCELDRAEEEKIISVPTKFFEAVNERLLELIRKQRSSLRLENLRSIYKSLDLLLNESVCKLPVSFAERMPRGYISDPYDNDSNYRTYMIAAAWKMSTFKECIMCGHMDARIFGVDGMADLFLEAHGRFYKEKPSEEPLDPVIQYLIDFIHQHKIIRYLIGVGSHHQVVSRSKNILLFLGATKQYTDNDTDKIWDAIRNGQDPRVVEVVVDQAKHLLQWCTSSQLMHYFSKFQKLPTAEFDNRLRSLCLEVSHALLNSDRYGEPSMDFNMSLHTLYVRLLQEVYAEPKLSVLEKRDIRAFAQRELRTLFGARMPGVDRTAILSACLREMSDASTKACGSACVICMLLEEEDLSKFQTRFNFTQNIIEDMCRLGTLEKRLGINLGDFQETVTDRLSLIVQIIVMVPSTLTEDLTHKMWTSLVGEHALGNSCRNAAWAMLGQAISQCGSDQQSLIDRILHEHFPNLEPSFFTPEILAFADSVTNYEIKMAKAKGKTNSKSTLQCGDLLWSVALKTTNSDIAATAIDRLVHYQLHLAEVYPLEESDSTIQSQIAFIQRAVQNLISAATELRSTHRADDTTSGTIIALNVQSATSLHLRRCVHTSLTILRKFVTQARNKPSTSPRAESIKSHGASSMPGDKVTILFQAHAAGKSFNKASLEIGDLATINDLSRVLLAKTGFSKLNVIVGGAKIDLSSQAETSIREIPSLFSGLVLVQKLPSDNLNSGSLLRTELNSFDSEVMKHFHAIYDLLDLDFELGREIYGFLSSFPPHEEIVAKVCNPSTNDTFALPTKSTFKCLYCIFALQTTVAQTLQEGIQCAELIAYGVQLISAAILAIEPIKSDNTNHHGFVTLGALAAALIRLLKEPVPPEISLTYFTRPRDLIEHLIAFNTRALQLDSPLDLLKPIEHCFVAILEALLHSHDLRSYFTSRPDHFSMIKMMLLERRYAGIREVTKNSLEGFLVALARLPNDEFDHFHDILWRSLQSWISVTGKQPFLTDHFFSLAMGIFRNLSDRNRNALPLSEYASQWSLMLSEHRHFELVGRPVTNFFALGVASLLRECLVKSKGGPVSTEVSSETMGRIFRNLLFPDIVLEPARPARNGRTPILDPLTRFNLYGVFLGDNIDMIKLLRFVGLCNDLFDISPPSEAWSWGYAQPSHVNAYLEPNRAFDGSHAVRSPTGYPGLKNLANTCYMNSLLTQLFMNKEFRDFILDLRISDPHDSEKLVNQIQRIFVYLQESCLHAIDPGNIAEAIVTYDNTPIDVTIQMDVDEFYNLLFDRLENQIPDAKDKWKLRRFYGGRIVQQIKSKDCPHISERIEPFQAIQCDILGKSSLEDSLKAYVEGEVMEGDNKYSCSSCGAYVNAVKRACFKDVPDNVIFHLKRFDFDLATGTRSKINDFFQFPEEIDLAPFNVDYLQDTSAQPDPDVFALVGVLIHTGHAESGHYYSYIRDKSSGVDHWLEFNDSEVTYFDWKAMQSSSFGGLTDGYDSEPFMKPWNAYMLFYRRKDTFTLAADQQQRRPPIAHPRLPPEVSNEIRVENELFLRRYAMFSPEHGSYVTALLEKYVSLKTTTTCSDDHLREKEMIHFALLHLDEIFSRQRDSQYAVPVMQAVDRIIEGCNDCAMIFLTWLFDNIGSFHSLLLKCPMEKERRAIATLIQRAVCIVRDPTTSRTLPQTEQVHQRASDPITTLSPVTLVFKALIEMLPSLHQYHRAWDDFFGLLCDLASLGSFERNQLRSLGVLRYVLQILAVHGSRHCVRMWPEFEPLLKATQRRYFSFQKLILLADLLIREAEPLSEPGSGDDEQPTQTSQTGLDPEEAHVLLMRTSRELNAPLAVLQAVFQFTLADTVISEQFVATLLHTAIGEQNSTQIYATILCSATVEPAGNADPWLCGAHGFIQNAVNSRYVKSMIDQIAQDAGSLVESGGQVYLNFFERVRQAQNPALMADEPFLFKTSILRALPKFGATLLMYPRAEVRERMLDLLQLALEECQKTEDEVFAAHYRSCALALCINCVQYIEEHKRQRIRIDVRRIDTMQHTLRWFITEAFARDDADRKDPQISEIMNKMRGALETLETIATSSPEEFASGEEDDSDSGVTEYSHV